MENKDIFDLELSVRATNVLMRLNIKTLEDITKVSTRDLLGTFNVGKKTIHEIRLKLAEYDLSFLDEVVNPDLKKILLVDIPNQMIIMRNQLNEMAHDLNYLTSRVESVGILCQKTQKKHDEIA
jgi:hypothetical protein